MRDRWFWVVGVVLVLAGNAGAQGAWAADMPPPLHPTVIYADYQGQSLPIVSVSGEAAQVKLDGKLKRLPRKARFEPRRGRQYAPGELQLRDMKAGSSKTNLVLMFDTGAEVSGGTVRASSDFSATVTPSQDYHHCYVAIVFFDQGFLDGTSTTPDAAVQFEKIKDLVGGQPNKVRLDFAYIEAEGRRLGFFPLFFTEGLEIRSDQCELIARFFRRIEETRHEYIVGRYRETNPSATAPVRPYLQIPPLFTDSSVLAAAPATAEVSFMVNEEGRVESLQFEQPLSPGVSAVLGSTLNSWLFLPRLKEGRPMRTMVRVPIQLRVEGTTPASS